VYGRTKWVGEQVVRDLLPEHYVVRIAWLYSAGPRNFVRTVLRLAAERDSLTMVTDEVGSPTYAPDLAVALSQLIQAPAYGIYHLPNSGVCSRHDWTAEILRLAGLAGKVKLSASSGYQRAAQVPKYVELRNFFGAEHGITMRPWQEALAECMAEIKAAEGR
jgi:dTDP-4-dehydrorhamnose reductase